MCFLIHSFNTSFLLYLLWCILNVIVATCQLLIHRNS
nr:MAG TPA: hypothetical protein [Caudoviricetes sp.]